MPLDHRSGSFSRVMDENGVPNSTIILNEEKNPSLYPMFFGVSCAFSALKLMSEPENNDEKWLEVRNRMLQEGAHLLGLLVWRVQKEEAMDEKLNLLVKLENAEKEISELKLRRSEDAKANEKVVSIFAAQEQGWFDERKMLKHQIGSLENELRLVEEKNEKFQKEMVSEEGQKRREVEQKLKNAEDIAEEMKDNSKCEAQRCSAEKIQHESAFVELVSSQHQLEADMSRALEQFKEAKQELDSALEQKEQSVLMTQKLSKELVETHKDLKQKDQIFSAMLRKSKMDKTEKQMLVKDVKLSNSKKKQAELETEKWKAISESRHEKVSLKNLLSKHTNYKLDISSGGKNLESNALKPGITKLTENDRILEYEHSKFNKVCSAKSKDYSTEQNGEVVDKEHLKGWVRPEAEKYQTAIEQRHNLEIDAFAEQMRLKDEKLEAFHGRLLSLEVELTRLHCHIESLNHDMARLRQDNVKLEALLLNREEELTTLREELASHLSPPKYPTIVPDLVLSKIKIIKRKSGEKEQAMKITAAEICQHKEKNKEDGNLINMKSKDTVLTIDSPEKKNIEDTKAPGSGCDSFQGKCAGACDVKSALKMDLHALGVSYKIKRLKQQLNMLGELMKKRENSEIRKSNDDNEVLGVNGFYTLLSLLNKQIGRYQSIQTKIDDLCKQMRVHDLDLTTTSSENARMGEETEKLEHFLEETFLLQRYMVATGQKLMELQAKIDSWLVGTVVELDRPASFDVKRFANGFRTLFREIQRGLEVQIGRIIGDLEGALSSDVIVRRRK